MESWRKNLSEQDGSMRFDNLGELRKAIAVAIQAKKKKVAGDEIVKTGADALLGAVPIVGNAASIGKGLLSVIKTAYKLDDKEEIGAGLDSLNVDDMISMIVDDKVENKFLSSYLKQFQSYPDSTPLSNLNATKALQQFINQEYRRKIER